jgi:hypothetical protein
MRACKLQDEEDEEDEDSLRKKKLIKRKCKEFLFINLNVQLSILYII